MRRGLIFSDLGTTCFLLQFFLLFEAFLTSWQTRPGCDSAVLQGIILELHSAGASNSFPFPVNAQEHLARGLSGSASATVRFKQWLSVFDAYRVLMGEEFAGEVHLLVSSLSPFLLWQRVFLQALLITWALQIRVKSLVLLFLALIAGGSGLDVFLLPFLPCAPTRMSRNPCQLEPLMCYFSSRR